MSEQVNNLLELAKRVRHDILVSTTAAGSGHATSSLSAVELMVALMFGGHFRFDVSNPNEPNNDRLIFSKGHASPLFYALWATAGQVSPEELLSLRQLTSRLEGHPTNEFPFTEVPTGSLGQGLSAGVGIALAGKIDELSYKTFVLLGDSEFAEGSNWEALEIAARYKLGNLIGILDVNRLGQRGETLHGHDLLSYEKKVQAFGWRTYLVDGHSLDQIHQAYLESGKDPDTPFMIIAKTMKGKGFSIWENKEGWHSKTLSSEQVSPALQELGTFDKNILGKISSPEKKQPQQSLPSPVDLPPFSSSELIATKKAVAQGILKSIAAHPEIIALDAEVSNSTHMEDIKKTYSDHFLEMFVAEQNMVGTALGLATRGKLPIVSTFAAFFTRAFDQIRMAGQAQEHIIYLGSYAGVSIGKDGGSQMGLEDIALFRSVFGSTVLYPSDATSADKLAELAIAQKGSVYIRTTREPTPILYSEDEEFRIGGSKTVRSSEKDQVTVVAAGITVHEALKAFDELQKVGVSLRIIDLYSIKPLDTQTLMKALQETQAMIIVEDHYPEGGIAETIKSALTPTNIPIVSLAVRKIPHSGTPQELLEYENISAAAIVKAVYELIK